MYLDICRFLGAGVSILPRPMMQIAYSPISAKFCFISDLLCFPLLDHDAFIHHALHVLDVPVGRTFEGKQHGNVTMMGRCGSLVGSVPCVPKVASSNPTLAVT